MDPLDDPPADIPMSFAEHLEELRRRSIYALLGVGVALAATLLFTRPLIAWLCAPLLDALRGAGVPAQTYAFSPVAGFALYMKVSTVAALILASPWVLYQAWRFVAVGLYPAERRTFFLIAPFSAAMTLLGVLFFYYVMLPITLWFLISFSASYPEVSYREPSRFFSTFWGPSQHTAEPVATETSSTNHAAPMSPTPPSGSSEASGGGGVPASTTSGASVPSLSADPPDPREGQIWYNAHEKQLKVHLDGQTHAVQLASQSLIVPLIEISSYLSFVAFTSLGVVVAFQLPVVMQVLGWTGLIDPEFFARYRRHCIFACFALGMVLTPPDVISMLLFSFPLWGLFELGLFMMRRAYRSRRTAAEM